MEHLFVSRDREEVDYWVVIPERNIETVRVLVKQQQAIIRLFMATANSPLQVDSHIVYCEGRDATELVPNAANSIQMD